MYFVTLAVDMLRQMGYQTSNKMGYQTSYKMRYQTSNKMDYQAANYRVAAR